jgi:large subunit ribosomal protein L22
LSDEERKARIDDAADAGVEETAEESKKAAAAEAAEEKAEATAEEPEAPADESEAEEKPKPKPRRRKKAEPKADAEDSGGDAEDAEDAKREAADEEAEAEAAEADGEPEDEDAKARPKRRRRGAAEVTAGRKQPARRRSPEEIVTVRANAKYVRTAPRKARLVIDHIRGKPVEEARALLLTTPRAASRDVLKLLDSAIANAENNHELVADELVVGRAYVDEGPTLKRYRPRALGRATRIRKRTSHMTIELTNTNTNGNG